MLVKDIVHRLRIRANEAQAQGQEHLAQDLRLAIDALLRLDRESQLFRPTQRQQIPA